MFDRIDALGLWLWLSAAQTTLWLGLGLLVSRRFSDRPAAGHRRLVLAGVAALASVGMGGVCHVMQWGLFVGPEPAAVFRVAGDAGPHAQGDATWQPAGVLAVGWLVVSGTLLLRVVRSVAAGQRCFGRCPTVADDELSTTLGQESAALQLAPVPQLVRSASAATPLVWAFGGRSRVVLPAERLASGVDWRAVFRHELAHLRRGDSRAALFGEVLAAVLFWQPLAWVVRRRLRLAAEFACDDWALAGGATGVGYAETLLRLLPSAAAPPALAVNGDVATRIARLMRAHPVASPFPERRRWAGMALALGLAVGVALLQARPGPQPGDASALPAPPPPVGGM